MSGWVNCLLRLLFGGGFTGVITSCLAVDVPSFREERGGEGKSQVVYPRDHVENR